MSRDPWPLVLASCLAWSSCATAPSSTDPEPSRGEAADGATAEVGATQPGTDAGEAPAVAEPPAIAAGETNQDQGTESVSEAPAPRPGPTGAASPATASTGAPAGVGAGEAAPPTPEPSTPEERAAARLSPTRVERVRPHLPAGTELHGVSLLATADTARGPLDALLVRRQAEGGVVATVLVLDARDALVAELPRARAGGPDALRVGSLLVPLADRATLEALGRGEVDLSTADAVLRLAQLVARDRLLAAADEGWAAFDRDPDPDVLVLGVAPQAALAPGELPMAGPFAVPETFRVGRALPSTLEGWRTSDGSWQGRVRVEAEDASGAPLVLVVGVQGRLPR